MRNGIRIVIPAPVVRAAAAVLAVGTVAVLAVQLPDIRRYLTMKTM